MNQNLNQFYEESGKAYPLSISLSVTCSLITILFFSYIYSLIITYLPIVYFNVLLVIVFGFLISFISKLFNHIFKIRNKKKSIVITFGIALFAVYFQWVCYLFILSSEDLNVFNNLSTFFNILIRPDLVITNIIEINRLGTWQMGSLKYTGIVLWLIWLIEASIIVYTSYNNYSHFDTIPFSEKDNNWYKKEYVDFDFEHIAFKKQFIEEIKVNAFDAISNLEKGNGLRHSELSIYSSETESKCLIAIDNIIITERGKGKKDVTHVLTHYYIDNIYLKQIREKFKFKKASILEF